MCHVMCMDERRGGGGGTDIKFAISFPVACFVLGKERNDEPLKVFKSLEWEHALIFFLLSSELPNY